ncbi:Holliday junction branch migration protein RuvA [Atopobacter phocae]|uniref:Holliday junction branch migration protein RuvA n=1 Tax=Atopobacter phocae TaxID=136492 RepID=UPI0004B93432|nr:Holliday junction branch migration protein RuvA [Atopobacter phocae]
MLYDYLIGKLVHLTPKTVTLEVNQIGYLIYLPNPYALQDRMNETLKIYVHHATREDDESLYGFLDHEDRLLFEQLISVSGIGPKSALAIVASEHFDGFVTAVENADQKFLTRFPGVGKKTAAQIILDLQGKLVASTQSIVEQIPQSLIDMSLALESLGYSKREIIKVEKELKDIAKTTNTQTLLKQAFKLLLDK